MAACQSAINFSTKIIVLSELAGRKFENNYIFMFVKEFTESLKGTWSMQAIEFDYKGLIL